MKLRELFKQLVYGELYLHSAVDNTQGIVKPNSVPRLVFATEAALLNIYTRFVILEEYLAIQTVDTVSVYDLTVEHAQTDPTEGYVKYIIDTEFTPFTGDLLKVLNASNEFGCFLPLNDSEECFSVFTPKYNQVQLPTNARDQTFFIGYQAKHPTLVIFDDLEDTLDQEVEIPPVLEEALRTKIAHTLYSGMSGQEDSAKALTLENRFEYICQDVEGRNLVSQNNISTNTKLKKRGFA